MRICAWAIASLCLSSGAAWADAATFVLHDVRIIDGNGGTPLEHAHIVIRGDRIAAVGSPQQAAIPAGATVITLSGKTVVPGLISNHSHLGMVNGISAGGRNVTRANILRQLKQYEIYGVTTVTSLGLNLDSFYELQPELHRGSLPGADMYGADRGFGAAGGAPPAGMGILETQVYRPMTIDEARDEVGESARRHPDLLKIWVDDFHGTMPIKMDPSIYRAIIGETHREGLRVAAHVFYLEDAKRLVADGVDILAHGVRDRRVDTDLIRAMKAHHVWYIPTLGLDESQYRYAEKPALADQPFVRAALQPELAAEFADAGWRNTVLSDAKAIAAAKQSLQMNLTNLKILYDAGAAIGFGTDSGATPLRIAGYAEHRELQLLVDAGLTPLQAIGTATKNAAALLQLDDRGVIEPGKLADLLIVDGNPAAEISDIDHIEAVWHRGRQVAHRIAAFHAVGGF